MNRAFQVAKVCLAVNFAGALVAGTVLYSRASAQQAIQPPQERTVTLTVAQSELVLIGKGLGKLPFEEVAVLLGKLQGQINSQVAPSGAPSTEVTPSVEPK